MIKLKEQLKNKNKIKNKKYLLVVFRLLITCMVHLWLFWLKLVCQNTYSQHTHSMSKMSGFPILVGTFGPKQVHTHTHTHFYVCCAYRNTLYACNTYIHIHKHIQCSA